MSLWDRILAVHCNTRFFHQGIVRGAIGLMTAGCCDFADIEKFSGDVMFMHLVGKDIPSQETFRQRMNQMLEAGYEADKLFLRVDSGHDSADFIEAAETLGVKYLDFIKIGCKLVKHANATLLKVSRCFTYIDALRRVEAIC